MKNIFLTLALILFAFTLAFSKNVDESAVPAAVKTTFNTKFPKNSVLSWDLKEGIYKVFFEIADSYKYAAFKTDGSLLESGDYMDSEKIPGNLTGMINKMFKDNEGFEAYSVVDATNVKHFFVVVTTQNAQFDILINAATGKITRQQKEEYEEEDSYDDSDGGSDWK